MGTQQQPRSSQSKSSSKKGGSWPVSPKLLLSHVFVGASCFYWGLLMGAQTTIHSSLDCTSDEINPERRVMMAKIKKQTERISLLTEQVNKNADPAEQHHGQEEEAEDTDSRFPRSMATFMAGMAAVDRTAFTERFDVGVPLEESSRSNSQVLLMYSHPFATPTISDPFKAAKATSNTRIPNLLDVEVATENCDILNVILTQPNEKKQCFAFVGQYRSFHIQKFMRLPEYGKLDHSAPLRLVNRGAQSSGRVSARVPTMKQTEDYWKTLPVYLQNLNSTLYDLKPLTERAAVQNTVIVMVCNHGQSELLMNFACSSRARGFDISSVVLFATDRETKELAEGLGMNVFFDEKNYGHFPKRAAGRYADKTFTAIMMAKVYCVQMTLMLKYDVLFLDVDIVWYKNPLEFFHDKSSPIHNFDIYFQDDGSRGLFYAPYSANTGMYYVRNNDKTRYFFNSLLLAGDLITSTHSHQIALVSLLSEHASMYNLKVKVLGRDTEEFPGGFTYHRKNDYMKDLFAGKVKPYLFHMSWTENKKNKQRFFKQMGNWYLQDKCAETTVEKILRKDKSIAEKAGNSTTGHLLEACCSLEPLVTCSFRDKPSIIPCKDSPPLDEGKKSFW